MRAFTRLTVLFAAALAFARPASAAEGMWTFDNFPREAVRKAYGLDIDQAWLDQVRGAGVRLSIGCSASVVSPQGLVLTNHHCVSDCLQVQSTAQRNLSADGFTAKGREEELRCAGMRAEILEAIDDVTQDILRASEGKTGADYVRARDAEVAALETSRCAGREATHRCQVVTLYQGGRYALYTFRSFSDVRLVLAPEFKMAFFGGDPDNFNFPRYDLDFSFLRLYENGRPASTPIHLAWATAPPKAGEPVFVVGNPGSTDRLLTADQLEFLRDVRQPVEQLQRSELRGRLIQFSDESAEHERLAEHDLFGIENTFKAIYGAQQALRSSDLIARKRAEDQALKAASTANPDVGDPWSEIAAAQQAYRELYLPVSLLEQRAGSMSQLFDWARTLVRAAEERGKPNGRRLPEYGEARLPEVEQSLMEVRPADPELEALYLEFWLAKVREYLTADAPETQALLGSESPESLAERLATSRLGDVALRRALWEGGATAIKASNDPMIRFVAAIEPTARQLRQEYERRVAGPVGQAAERIAAARFAAYGTAAYPDATFTPRISYGAVEGWTYQGRQVAPFTTFAGMYERASGHAPYDLPPRWPALKEQLDLSTVLDLSSSNDIIGGNSGSPLINAKGEVVGAVFDGNIHSLGGAYGYDQALNRTVSVSTAAITEALRKAYGANTLLAELGVR